jgi:hypothetical protein
MLTTFFSVALLLPLAGGSDDPVRGSAGQQDVGEEKQPPRSAARALREVVPEARFEAMPLEDFLEWVERQTKVNVVVRWAVLERAGVTRDTPVSLSLNNVRLGQVLMSGLGSAAAPDEPLAYRISGNVITISTRRDFRSQMFTEIYEIQDLLIVAPNFRGEELNPGAIGSDPRREGARGGRGAAGSGSGGGGTLFQPPGGDREDPLKDADQQVRDLVAMITSTVLPETWHVNGGQGTIAYYQGKLVIRNSAEVHQMLRTGLKPTQRRSQPRE